LKLNLVLRHGQIFVRFCYEDCAPPAGSDREPLAEFRRVQPIRLRFQQVEVLPWELSVHPGSYNRLMGG
jgi:hypothetical protein